VEQDPHGVPARARTRNAVRRFPARRDKDDEDREKHRKIGGCRPRVQARLARKPTRAARGPRKVAVRVEGGHAAGKERRRGREGEHRRWKDKRDFG
jgi:hypothetical protein